jgi:hypothetical protein
MLAPHSRTAPPAAAGARYVDPVIEAYKKDVDQTLIDESLRRTVQQRIDAMIDTLRAVEELQRAGKAAQRRQPA